MTMNVVKKFASTRRRVLGGLGAGALGASAGLFGRTEATHAASSARAPYCCNLAHSSGPNYIQYSDCARRAAYIWLCDSGPGRISCNCCETAGNAQSAAKCWYP
jgi:hypothetical protein